MRCGLQIQSLCNRMFIRVFTYEIEFPRIILTYVYSIHKKVKVLYLT